MKKRNENGPPIKKFMLSIQKRKKPRVLQNNNLNIPNEPPPMVIANINPKKTKLQIPVIKIIIEKALVLVNKIYTKIPKLVPERLNRMLIIDKAVKERILPTSTILRDHKIIEDISTIKTKFLSNTKPKIGYVKEKYKKQGRFKEEYKISKKIREILE